MWVFFCLLALLGLMLFGKFEINLKNQKGREKFFWMTVSFCGVRIYRKLFFLHFKHVVRPEIIEVTAAKSFARALGLKNGQIAVRPDFDQARCHLWLDGIVCLSLVNIIGRLIKEMRQRKYASDRTRIKHYHV